MQRAAAGRNFTVFSPCRPKLEADPADSGANGQRSETSRHSQLIVSKYCLQIHRSLRSVGFCSYRSLPQNRDRYVSYPVK